jgi:lipopolysaccharide/colanic/teichoic acid biosynthesis glycosyltransferase
MHLLIVHQNFVDHQHPGGTRHFELARHLVQRGHRCTIVAGSVDFLTGQPLPRAAQTLDGVVIRRAYAFPTIHHSYVGRAASYLCFMVTSIWEGLRAGPVDAVLGTSPPMFQLPSAWLIARLRGLPFLLEIRDLWPDFAVEMGVLRSPLLIRAARWIERFFYRHHDITLVNSPGFVPHLCQAGLDPAQITVIPNGVETAMFDPTADGQRLRDQFGLQGAFVVTYAGSLGRANDLDTVLRAAARLQSRPAIRFLLVGAGKELTKLRQRATELGLQNVVFGGHFSKTQMADVFAASDVCLATLQPVPLFRTVYPNKVFDYMAAGRPTILAIDGAIREVIEAADGGVFVAPGDDQGLAEAVSRYADDPKHARRQGMSARRYVEQHFERADQALVLEKVLERIPSSRQRPGWYTSFAKRALDFLAALLATLVLSPVILVVFLLVRYRLGAPAVFRQPRAGWRGRVFTVYKFRTMTDAVDAQGKSLPDEQRLTPFGQRLRSLSLDELPQLWNILRGEMSLVGPRPLLVRYLLRYSAEQMRRHAVRPGITGWAQVNGRNAIDWDKKFRLDVWYVDHVSFWLDLKILGLTLAKVVRRDGIQADQHATMPEFMGDEPATESRMNGATGPQDPGESASLTASQGIQR